MARRFSDINRGGELKLAMDNYNKYRTDMTTRQSVRVTGTGTPKAYKQIYVAIYPFSVALIGATGQDYLVKLTTAVSGTTVPAGFAVTEINNYFDKTPATTAKAAVLPPKGFRAARARTFEPTGAAAYKKSKFTQLYYAKTPGTTNNYPIGRLRSGAATSDEAEARKAIRVALTDLLSAVDGRRVSFTDEKASVR